MANTEPYPTGWNTIHVGIDADDISDSLFISFTDTVKIQGTLVYINGDGWQEWNALPGTGKNDTSTLHIQMAAQTKADAVILITALRESGLLFVPRPAPGEHGNSAATIIATRADDWSEIFYTELTESLA